MLERYHRGRDILRGSKPFGFTLLEILVSCVLFTIVALLSFSIINSVSNAWKAQQTRLSTFEGARVGFELVTNRLSQATLNTYWDYDIRGTPTKYIRQSELHYIQGSSADLLPDITDSSTQSVFFVAPLGFTETGSLQPLVKMLTACGFYISFSGEPDRPDFLNGKIPERYRYRLYQYLEAGENLAVYQSPAGNDWFRTNLTQSSHPIIENVIGLIVRAKYPDKDGKEVPTYSYDSRSTTPTGATNQLPPNLEVTLVVIDEDSARRLEAVYGENKPPILPPANKFDKAEEYEDDLNYWEDEILRKHIPKINYRVFTANIPIRGAKWSSN